MIYVADPCVRRDHSVIRGAGDLALVCDGRVRQARLSKIESEFMRTLLGMLTPSSNTVLEPVSSAMLAALPEVTAHFARFPVSEIALDAGALDQFALEPMLAAARLLADARVHVICWNGTSAGWLGFARDRALADAIRAATGVPATSSVLALAEIFTLTNVKRFGLVSPYLGSVQTAIVETFRREGYACIAERHLDLRDNFAFSEVSADTLRGMIREVAAARPQAITVLCTNLGGAPLVAELERETGIPIYDSVATALWGALRLARVEPSCLQGWGRLFTDVR